MVPGSRREMGAAEDAGRVVTAAERQARYRQRQRAGRVVLRIDVDLVDTTEMLAEAGYLDPSEEEDHAAVALALSRLIASLAERYA